MGMDLKTISILAGVKPLMYDSPDESVVQFDVLQTSIKSYLEYLLPPLWRVDSSIYVEEGSDLPIWELAAFNGNGNFQYRYRITNIVDCIHLASAEIDQLLQTNPSFHNKRYLFAVGIERALVEFNIDRESINSLFQAK